LGSSWPSVRRRPWRRPSRSAPAFRTSTPTVNALIEAIVNANNDAATHADCAAGSGADKLVLSANSTHTLTALNNNTYGPNGLPLITAPCNSSTAPCREILPSKAAA